MVRSRDGLHARPCAAVVSRVKASKSRVTVRARAKSADGASVFGLLTLEAARGTELVLEVEGPDAEAVLADLERIFSAEE